MVILSVILSGNTSADSVFVVEGNQLSTIPEEFLYFSENLNENASLKDLTETEWTNTLESDQSFVDGYWVRFKIRNISGSKDLGLNHNWNREKKIFSVNSKASLAYEYWMHGVDSWIGDGRVLGQYRIEMPIGDVTTVYDFFRSRPFDRFMGRVGGLHRITIGLWEDIRLREFIRFASNIGFISIAISFGFYYLFMYLVSSGSYLWLSLSLFQASLIVFLTQSNGMLLGLGTWFGLSEFSFVLYSILFIFLLQFLRHSQNLAFSFRTLDKFLILLIIFYGGLALLNFYTALDWPGDKELDLIKHPPDRAGPGIIKLQYLVLPFFLGFISTIITAIISWFRGSRSAKYMCLSFMMPLLSVPISFVAYLLNGFSWSTMLIATTSVGLLFLLMFVTFGLSVAQQLNDLRLLAFRQQVQLTEAYQRFVPKQLLSNLKKDSILDVSLGDQVNTEMTILFSDIRSFTAISEKMNPRENFAFVNLYLSRMGPIVRKNSGYIDKFMGDGIMAIFPNSPSDAVRAGIEMQNNLVSYNETQEKDRRIEIGVGINTGKMMLGTIGESDRMEGSVISDSVNLAARLEELTKIYKSKILISENTASKLIMKDFQLRLLDVVAVKGKEKAVKVFEVLNGDSQETRDLKIDNISLFNDTLNHYRNQDFEIAMKNLQRLQNNNPHDGAVYLYLKRCEKILQNADDATAWDGVSRFKTK